MKPEELIDEVIAIATDAGRTIREIYLKGNFERETKSDNTPVTSADLAANKLICERLAALTPDIPILSEEAADIPLSERVGWKLLKVREAFSFHLTDTSFSARPEYKRNDKAMNYVFAQL